MIPSSPSSSSSSPPQRKSTFVFLILIVIVFYGLASTIVIITKNNALLEHQQQQQQQQQQQHGSTGDDPPSFARPVLNVDPVLPEVVAAVASQQARMVEATDGLSSTSSITPPPPPPLLDHPDNSGSRSGGNSVPRLPVISKPHPIPPFQQVKEWMSTDGNQTAGQFMLDFAVLGFAKCGTSTMMFWLGNQPEVFVPGYEVTALTSKPSWEVIREMYHYADNNNNNNNNNKLDTTATTTDNNVTSAVNNNNAIINLRGFKSPNDIMDTRPVRILRDYFPNTKIIIGLRHPIYMIESFYNHRIQNGLKMPPMEKLPYSNMGFSHLVTLGRAAYHDSLIHLGKTNFTSVQERSLVHFTKRNAMKKDNILAYPPSPNKVYLYDTAQLADIDNTTRITNVLRDIENFLGLTQPLDPPLHFSPGKKQESEKQRIINSRKADICEDRYVNIRNELIGIGKAAQEWILTYFLESPDVYVSNRDHFQEILRGYTKDPCPERNAKRAAAAKKAAAVAAASEK